MCVTEYGMYSGSGFKVSHVLLCFLQIIFPSMEEIDSAVTNGTGWVLQFMDPESYSSLCLIESH